MVSILTQVGQTLTLGLQWYEFKPTNGLISNHWFKIIPVRDGGTWPKLISPLTTTKKMLGGGPIIFCSYVGDNQQNKTKKNKDLPILKKVFKNVPPSRMVPILSDWPYVW